MDLMDLGHNGNGFNWIFIAIFIAGEVVRLQFFVISKAPDGQIGKKIIDRSPAESTSHSSFEKSNQ